MIKYDESFDFKVPCKADIKSFLNWYRYYIIGAEKFVRTPYLTELKNFDLCGFDFSNLDLYEITFTNCNLSSCKFTNSNLYNAHFDGCIICHADFSDAIIEKASFVGCKLYDTSFSGCSSYGTWFPGSIGLNTAGMVSSPDKRAMTVVCEPLYRHSDCHNVMREINQHGLELPDFEFYENLDVVDYPYKKFGFFTKCFLRIRNFFEKKLNHNQCLVGYFFTDYDFSQDKLNGFTFRCCFFENTIFPHSTLKEITFCNSRFENVDFSRSQFENVRFVGCIFWECKVSESQLDNFKQESSLYYSLKTE